LARRFGAPSYAADQNTHYTPWRNRAAARERKDIALYTLLVIILVILLLGALPTWPYSGAWGYYPSGGLGLVLLIVIVLLLMGRI
jgi:hypothetical protein